MKFKILVIFLFLAVLSPFLLHKYNKDLSKKFVEYYINSRFSHFSSGAHISFKDFQLKKEKNVWELVIYGMRVTQESKEIALLQKTTLSFSWNFPFTRLQPLSVTIWNTNLQFPIKPEEKSSTLLKVNQVDRLFSLITLLNTDIFVKKLQFNEYGINEGFMRVKKMNHKKVLQIGIHEEKAEIEIEIIQSQYDTVAVKVTNFNPNNSIVSPILRELSEIKIAKDDFTFSGYVLFDLNQKTLNGIVKDLHGSIKRNGEKFRFNDGEFIIKGHINKLELENVRINIDDSKFSGTLFFDEDLSIEGKITNLSSENIMRYWNEEKAPEARKWFEKNIKSGVIKEAEIKLDNKIGSLEIRDAYFERVTAEIDLANHQDEKTQTIYLDGFSGNLNLIDENLRIVSTSGTVDSLFCEACITNVNQLHTTIEGTLLGELNTLVLLGKKVSPNSIKEIETKTNLQALHGQSKTHMFFEIPYASNSQIRRKLKLEASDLRGENFYYAFSISSGNAKLEMDDTLVRIDADLVSSGEKANVKLTRDFQSQITDLTVEGTSLVEPVKNSGFLPAFPQLKGKVNGKITLQILQNGNLNLAGRINLENVEEDFLQLFGWEKDPNATFLLKINKAEEVYHFKKLDIVGKNLELRLRGTNSKDLTFLKSEIFKVNDSHLDFTYLLKKGTSNLVINSKSADLSNAKKFSPILLLEEKKKNTKSNIEVNIGELKLKNAFSLLKLGIKVRDGDGNLSAVFSDGTILGASFSKYGGITVDTTNMGTLLKSLEINSGILGGRASFYLGTKDSRSNDGVLLVENFYMQDAPVLARILSLSSLYGIMNVLNGEGIFFERFFSRFRYADGIFYISESWLEAAPIGLSVMGILSLTQDEAIIHGSVVPLYKLNKLIAKIPIIGMLVTAGKNRGIIAAEYTLTRKMGKSSVSVNTLSTFTPTILNKFFKVFD